MAQRRDKVRIEVWVSVMVRISNNVRVSIKVASVRIGVSVTTKG